MVTAETAMVLPALVAVVTAAVVVVSALAQQLRAVDLAGDLARAAARGTPAATLQRLCAARVPGSSATLSRVGGEEHVVVDAPVPRFGVIPGLHVQAAASMSLTAPDGPP